MTVFVELTCVLTRSVLGDAMSNVAATYSLLGRHQDGLVLQEKTLEFRRRVHPENHLEIGTSRFNLSLKYRKACNCRAIDRARKALRIWQVTLSPSHPSVQNAQELIRQIEGDLARRA